MSTLHKLHIKGYKSIRDQELEFGALNVFIGGNGAGKSNLIGVFRLLNQIENKQLQIYTGTAGGANTLLHFGRKKTQRLFLEAEFHDKNAANIYECILIPTDTDRFVFKAEATYFWKLDKYERPMGKDLWSGHEESRISETKNPVAHYVRKYLNSFRIYHFHDTSPEAAVKQTNDLRENRSLDHDAGNLAAFLYRLQRMEPDHFANIEDAIRQVAPFFGHFKLEPEVLNPEKIRLEWEEKNSDTVFGPAALSDGTLRFICLATLLLQPQLPSLVLIDEPELGLHPAAIQVLAGLLLSAATRTQLIVATQSVTLINQLEPEQVWVVDREEGQSVFRPLKSTDMSSWLDDYSLGELWEKNILGGRP